MIRNTYISNYALNSVASFRHEAPSLRAFLFGCHFVAFRKMSQSEEWWFVALCGNGQPKLLSFLYVFIQLFGEFTTIWYNRWCVSTKLFFSVGHVCSLSFDTLCAKRRWAGVVPRGGEFWSRNDREEVPLQKSLHFCHHCLFLQWTTGWWFQVFVIFTPTWGNDPIWLIFF